MAFRLYIVPVVGSGTSHDARRPKYFKSDATGAGLVGLVTGAWSGMDYGFEPWMVVGADLSISDDSLVVGQIDAFAIPFDLAPALSVAQVTNVQNKLESMNVPAGWVTTALTWLQVVRTVLGMFSLIQRYAGIHGVNGLFTGGVNLNSTISALPVQVRQDFNAAATSQGLDTSAITGTTTIRVALKLLADQMQSRQYNFNGTLL
jgi:hypothetical protein